MAVFKTLDTRGHSFYSAFDMASKAFSGLRRDGVLEIILDRNKDYTGAFKTWAHSKGHRISNIDEDHRMIRLFITKKSLKKNN